MEGTGSPRDTVRRVPKKGFGWSSWGGERMWGVSGLGSLLWDWDFHLGGFGVFSACFVPAMQGWLKVPLGPGTNWDFPPLCSFFSWKSCLTPPCFVPIGTVTFPSSGIWDRTSHPHPPPQGGLWGSCPFSFPKMILLSVRDVDMELMDGSVSQNSCLVLVPPPAL